jgi:hypothetical protein
MKIRILRNLHLTFTTESTEAKMDDDRFSFVIIHLGFYSLLNRDDSIPQNSGTLVLSGFLFSPSSDSEASGVTG